MELSGDFKVLVSSIEPGPQQVKDAKAAHEKVREWLRTDDESKEAHRDTFLSGSYARSTAINDIKDVDVICLLDIDKTITPPEVLLAWIQAILDRYYTETRRQGRSIGVSAAKNVWLDIVPSAPMTTNDGPLWIPDRDAHEWVQSHPKGQIAAAAAKNKATNGYFVQTVKLMKFWRNRLPTKSCQPKSYIIEALVHSTMGYPDSHAAAVVKVLENILGTYGVFARANSVPPIPDPGYPSVNVAKRWTSTEFNDFMVHVKSSAAIACQALNESDEAESRRLWRKLFGDRFGE